MKKIWVAYIKGIKEKQFRDNTITSFECKRIYTKSIDFDILALYYRKDDVLKDMKVLQEIYPKITFEIQSFARKDVGY